MTQPAAHHPTHHPDGSADRCSVRSLGAAEQAVGTAAEATCWVVLEQDGPWGARAATESRLDPGLGARLDTAVSGVGGRFALMREPGAHPDRHIAARPVIVSGGTLDDPWLVRGTVATPDRLLDLPVDALADPTPTRLLAALPELDPADRPVLLVCTNGKRDQCCALGGRPLAEAAHRAAPGQVVETTHLGGHRFAPTATVLPYGLSYGRLDEDTVVTALRAAEAGRIPTELADTGHYRGRSGLRRPQQAAELAYRLATGDLTVPGPPVEPAHPAGEDRWTVAVGTGRARLVVEVTRLVTDRLRPESCGKAAAPVPEWHTRVLGRR
ncbi:sucrase ferredoxin [Raineyella sp. W15-4]|uniref:sucrase ferredoxin n=1 Tax=Raineyella sp. W15-4 TaxID=3081651 RepID=UPI00295586F7|nr:sucrase ferredoxin [Raineyella sp. W15-4]WOQ18655.1 sucrase ferredoxin [Raineyella sp. W15-4]